MDMKCGCGVSGPPCQWPLYRVGVHAVRQWARTLPSGAAVIDLGCGRGFPITEILVAEGLDVFAIDAAPSFIQFCSE
jgi:2-polyprenyl-3-methyl-5-hydroxy-6-metoxy-1,4-benzoquinol methylase